jgi:MFS transporter, ACS family, tartrate transporter
MASVNALKTPDISDVVRRKVSRRVLPFFFLLYIVAYIDRANVAFAKLPMLADLGFSEADFGFGAGVFFLGYFMLEIPGALIVERWSARLWITRILITWGFITVLTGFIQTPAQFYTARFLLGLAEAGFFPGVIVYMSHWFPSRDRGRALAGFILAVPISFVIGAPLSTWCMSIDWFGLPGWRWIFIVQGLPAILFGCVAPFYLTDRPRDAQWLKREERDWLEQELQSEINAKRAAGHLSVLQAMRQSYVLKLAAALFFIVAASYGFILWLPTTIQKASGLSTSASTLLSGLPFLTATIAVWYNGRSSDRFAERKFHTVIPLLGAPLFFALTQIPDQPLSLLIIWMCMTGMMLWAWAPSFWVLPTLKLGESAAAASIGLINSIGNLGGFAGPWIVGAVLTSYGSYTAAVIFLCGCFLVAAALIASLPIAKKGRR